MLQHINKGRRHLKAIELELKLSKVHMKFCTDIYLAQVKSGLVLIH